ncbi:MAG: cytochrome c [Bryobacteraceae bacterium]
MSEEQRPTGPPPDDSGALPPLLGEPEREDVTTIHQSLLEREREEPKEGLEPPPWWVWAVSVVVIFAMGFYLGRYGGTFSAEPHELYEPKTAAAEAASETPRGDLLYSAVCIPCHQEGGKGLPGTYPPLAGSEWVAMDPGIPVRIVLHGLRGPIEVRGGSYANEMPPLGAQLGDAEIAAVLSYVRSSFGNTAGAVDADTVKKIRAETGASPPWTAEKLKALSGAKP